MKIAIIRLSALGDIIQTATILQFIAKNVPNAQIYWFCDEKFSEILTSLPELSRVISLPLKEKKFIRTYRILREFRGEFDIILDFQGLIKSAIIARILGANVAGFDKNGVREKIASKFYAQEIACDYGENVILRYLTLASKTLGFKFSENEILERKKCFQTQDLSLNSGAISSQNLATNKTQILQENLEPNLENAILIAPFSSEKSKNYAHFDAVIAGLKAAQKHEIYICYGNEREFTQAQKLAQISGAKILELQSAPNLICAIEKFALIIGNDSAISHLAWAQNRPSITLFGNRPSERNLYATPINLAIDAGKKIDARKIDKNDFCINEIDPQIIVKMVLELLNG